MTISPNQKSCLRMVSSDQIQSSFLERKRTQWRKREKLHWWMVENPCSTRPRKNQQFQTTTVKKVSNLKILQLSGIIDKMSLTITISILKLFSKDLEITVDLIERDPSKRQICFQTWERSSIRSQNNCKCVSTISLYKATPSTIWSTSQIWTSQTSSSTKKCLTWHKLLEIQ